MWMKSSAGISRILVCVLAECAELRLLGAARFPEAAGSECSYVLCAFTPLLGRVVVSMSTPSLHRSVVKNIVLDIHIIVYVQHMCNTCENYTPS